MTVPIYAVLDTWNAGATTFTGIGINVTDTASAAASLLLDLQVGSASKFSVRKDGVLTQPLLTNSASYSSAGTTQGTATPVTTDLVFVTASSATDSGIVLPSATTARHITVINCTNQRIKVYPASGESFAGQSTFTANLPAYLLDGATASLWSSGTGVWRSPGLWQGASGTFGIGSFVQTGSGSTQAGATSFFVTPSGGVAFNLSDSGNSFINGTDVFVSGAHKFGFYLTGNTPLAQLVPTTTPDISLQVGNTPLTVQKWGGVASAVNNFVMTNAATGNGIKLEAAGSDTNIDMIFNPKGTGNVQLGGGSWAANGSVATVLGSVGPTGANTTVQEWFAVKNASGVVRYIPGF